MTLGRKLLAMTRRSGPRNVPIPAVIPNALLPCHSEPLTPVSFRTNVRNPQLGIRREAVQNSRRFLVAALLGMTRGRASSSERPFFPCHSKRM
jgi:hypothetical protein